jgi:hypothetical protein
LKKGDLTALPMECSKTLSVDALILGQSRAARLLRALPLCGLAPTAPCA